MKARGLLFICLAIFLQTRLFAQYPPIDVSLSNVVGNSGSTVDVVMYPGTGFSNITTFNGTITWDTSIIHFNSIPSHVFSNPMGSIFNTSQAVNGILTYNYSSFITVGTYVSNGNPIFSIRFDVVGYGGQVSPVDFANSPVARYWANGFGWSGNNFIGSNGSVTVACNVPTAAYGATGTLFNWSFTDSSTLGQGVSRLWDFGDGNTSTQANPTHAYATGGIYTVCLTVSDSCGTDSVCHALDVCPTAQTLFNDSIVQMTAWFTNLTDSSATTFAWDFGDGATSNLENPSHTYATNGNYQVCLAAQGVCGWDTLCYFITVCPKPSPAFTFTSNALATAFTDQSTGAATTWSWDFGDGTTSPQQNPVHIFPLPGTYVVCLSAANGCGSNLDCQTVVVTCSPPTAGFSQVINGQTVSFSDLSTNSPVTWIWDFGDGVLDSTQNPAHTYAQPGLYTVCLTVQNPCGTDTLCKTLAAGCATPVAAFTGSSSQLTVQFTDQSTLSPTFWDWDFGDGGNSTQQNPSHAFAANGTYQVCLVSGNACGMDSVCHDFTVLEIGVDPGQISLYWVYPNPAQDRVRVSSPGKRIEQIALISLLGQPLRQWAGSLQPDQELSLAGLARGIYWLNVISQSGERGVVQLVVGE
ncbi:MAG: PKD domain-containing protein [Bacteroidia bacterium]|nr:PKD domain-containing protein [Bacteroidia bacterium]